jgi:hypothetical protein
MSFDTPGSKRKIEELQRALNLCDKCNEKLSNEVEEKLPYLVDDCNHMICRQCREAAFSTPTAPRYCPVQSCNSLIENSIQIFSGMVQSEAVDELLDSQAVELAAVKEKQREMKSVLISQWNEVEAIPDVFKVTSKQYILCEPTNDAGRITCLDVSNDPAGFVTAAAFSSMTDDQEYFGKIKIYQGDVFQGDISTGHSKCILDVKFNPLDNRILAIGSKDSGFSLIDRRMSHSISNRTALTPKGQISSVCWDTCSENNLLCSLKHGPLLLFDIRNVCQPLGQGDIKKLASFKNIYQDPLFYYFSRVDCFWGKDEKEFYNCEFTPNFVVSSHFGVNLVSINLKNFEFLKFDDCEISRKCSMPDQEYNSIGPIGSTAFDVNTKSLVLFEKIFHYDHIYREVAGFPDNVIPSFREKNINRELNFMQYPQWNCNVAQKISASQCYLWIPKSIFSLSFEQDGLASTTFDRNFIKRNSYFKETDLVHHHSSKNRLLCLFLANQSLVTVYDFAQKKAILCLNQSEDNVNLPPFNGISGFFDTNRNMSMAVIQHPKGFSTFCFGNDE